MRISRRSGASASTSFSANTTCEQRREFLLPRRRHQEIPERAEALALIAPRDGVALRKNLLQQRSLAAFERSDALAHRAVQRAEILLHFPEVAEQAARRERHLLKAILHLRGVEHGNMSVAYALYLRLDRGLAFLQVGDARRRVLLGSLRDLPQQREHRHQPRFGAHELPLVEARDPVDGAFRRRSEIVVRLIAARRIVFAQPTPAVGGPIVQVLLGPPRERLLPQLFAQAVKVIGQARRQFGLRHGAHIRLNERLIEEADDHRRVVGNQQAPRGIGLPKLVQGTIVHKLAARETRQIFIVAGKFCEPARPHLRIPSQGAESHELVAGYSLRRAHAAQIAGFRRDRGAHTGARHRRHHRRLQRLRFPPVEAHRLAAPGDPRDGPPAHSRQSQRVE